jgi:hypothetical protein
MCEDAPRISFCATIGAHTKPIAIIGLQPLISQRIFILADMGENADEEVEVARGQLFTLAGRLRELARIAEIQAGRINRDIANWQIRPSFQLFDENENSDDA